MEATRRLKPVVLVSFALGLFLCQLTEAVVQKIYWTDWSGDCVWRVNPDGTGQEKIVNVTMNSLDGIAVDPFEGKLYIGTSYDLLRSNLDGTGLETIVHKGSAFDVYGVTLDLNARKVYWSTWEGTKGIRRANLDGSLEEIFFSGVMTYHMEIDPFAKKLYWAASGKIQRANLNGSNVETLLTSTGFTGHFGAFDLDVANNKMYFSTWEDGGIYRANMNGSNVEEIVSDKTAAIALDLDAEKVYWTSWAWGLRDILRANLDGSNVETVCLISGSSNALALYIPEPGTLLLVGLGGAALLRKRRA